MSQWARSLVEEGKLIMSVPEKPNPQNSAFRGRSGCLARSGGTGFWLSSGSLCWATVELASLPFLFPQLGDYEHAVQRELIDSDHIIVIREPVDVLLQIRKLVLREFRIFPAGPLNLLKAGVGKQTGHCVGSINASRVYNNRYKHTYRIVHRMNIVNSRFYNLYETKPSK